MNNNQLKNILKLAINLSIKENKEIIPYLQKAYSTVELNENKTKEKAKKKKQLLENNPEMAKKSLQYIDELIKKESETIDKIVSKTTQEKTNDEIMLG
jgi:hypothetical protein